jgi:single-strand DNA-binding protein
MIVVQIAGRLGKDAESRFTSSGQKVTTLTLATNIRKGGKEEVTVWWRVTIWGDRFDKMMPYFKKGTALIVVGNMHQPNIWTDKEGRPQVGLEITADIIHFSPFGGSNSERTPQEGAQAQQPNYTASHSGYTAHQSNAGYGGGQGDFSGMMQGAALHEMTAESSEEQIPF